MVPRVFVSSVMEGFEEFRQAAKKGIIAAGAIPVLIEDFPALPVSPRNACLDGVDSSDIYVAILGDRGGWTSPSGKLVVEEEYDEACRRRLRILVFVKDTVRDDKAQHLVKTLSDYIVGMLRPTFTSSEELQNLIYQALIPLVRQYANPEVKPSVIQEKLINTGEFNVYNEACLRFVLAPERIGEVIDLVSIGSQELIDQVYNIAHSPQVRLFSYERLKTPEVGIDELVILQSESSRAKMGIDEVRLEITAAGMIVIDSNVSGRVARGPDDMSSYFYIFQADVEDNLRRYFAFCNAFYTAKDPYLRYDRLLYNGGLSGVGNRNFASQPPPPGSSHYIVHRSEEFFPAFDHPRLINKLVLANPQEEIERLITIFQRRLK
jgi:hypothetical protein